MKKIICLILISLFCGSFINLYAADPIRLFFIERSKNPNVVCYDAMLDSKDQINKENPIICYWISLAEKGRKIEDLSSADKKTYGFKTKYNENDNTFDLILNFIEDKPITILMVDGKPKVKMLINNVEAYLYKVYIQSTENWFGVPSESFYTLHGLSVNGNEPIEEKIIIK